MNELNDYLSTLGLGSNAVAGVLMFFGGLLVLGMLAGQYRDDARLLEVIATHETELAQETRSRIVNRGPLLVTGCIIMFGVAITGLVLLFV